MIRLDTFLTRLGHYIHERAPKWRAYRKLSHDVLQRYRRRLRLDELKPRVLSTFVRNKLIDEVYLPLIGDNLAKQMGAAGESGRSDRQGLLLLISPPGYGKTTLMEYVANRLGLTFMKINGPAIGHEVTSLDPSEAPNATARQEVDKLNLALRMGNNVMLYLDDIQHCNPELLQKFISLCDATRRIEGVWDGETKTYDLRGKRFSVVMAGNPYTETGERFQIPDMLANRADTYNLGDILEGAQGVFALSYIENALTSNPVLAPLANREKDDVYLFVRMAQGEEIPISDLVYGYSAVEANEIVSVLQKLFVCQQVLLDVNQAYIESASQDDDYRTEPPFKLQGSYRNMTKMAEKIVSAMNAEEVQALIDDHYMGEAQTLTTEAEQNLLKLKELRGTLTQEDRERWQAIKGEYQRRKMMGGGQDDPVSRVAGPLSSLVQQVASLHSTMQERGLRHPLGDIRDAISAAVERFATESASMHHKSALDPALVEQLAALATRRDEDASSKSATSTEHVEALLQLQTSMFEGALGALRDLADAQSRSTQQSAEALRAIEKMMGQQPVVLRSPPPTASATTAAMGAPAPGEENGSAFVTRPLTGVKQRVPFKEKIKNGKGRSQGDEISETVVGTSRTEDDNPQEYEGEETKVRLEPPFDEA